MTTERDDGALLRAMGDGDRDAFGELYDRYAPLLLAVARRILGDRRDSEDLVHDVLVEAWKQSRAYDPTRGSVRTWMLLRLRSRALDRRKSAAVSRTTAVEPARLADTQVAGGDDPGGGADRSALAAAMDDLGAEQRAVVELAYFEGLSCSEIATRVGVPIGTVKSRMAAALARLRADLGVGGGAS